MEDFRARARQLKRMVQALYLATRDPRTPWPARLVAGLVLAYALSPLDLVPDPIPVLGYLDDLILIPLGLALAIRLIPVAVWRDARAAAEASPWSGKPTSWAGAVLVAALWILAVAACWWLIRRWWG